MQCTYTVVAFYLFIWSNATVVFLIGGLFMVVENLAHVKRRTSEIDLMIGERIKAKRLEVGLGQSDLAKKLGITFQQLQKYEKGLNRVSAASLYKISVCLNCDISFFFDGLGGQSNLGMCSDHSQDEYSVDEDPDETAALLKGYYSIKKKATRKKFLNFLKSSE